MMTLKGPLILAAVLLMGCSSSPLRFLASTNSSDSLGLGNKFSCLKTGFSRAGYDKVSNRSLAMIAVVAKLQSSALKKSPEETDKTALANALHTVLAYGLCDQRNFAFLSTADAAQSAFWLNSPTPDVDGADYQKIFEIPKGFVMFYNTPEHPWTSLSSQRKAFFWTQYAEGFPPYNCNGQGTQPLPEGDKAKICKAVISSCGLESTACNEPGESEVE